MRDVFIPGGLTVQGPEHQYDVVDSTGAAYPRNGRGDIIIPKQRKDDGSESWPEFSDVVTSANGRTGDVKWVGGTGIRVETRGQTIKISADSDATDESPWDSSAQENPCDHPGDDKEGNGGGVSPDDDGGSGIGGGGGGGGGVSAGNDDTHIGDNNCCGPGSGS